MSLDFVTQPNLTFLNQPCMYASCVSTLHTCTVSTKMTGPLVTLHFLIDLRGYMYVHYSL